MSLSNKTAIGILWNFSDQLLRRGMASLVTLLLARLLVPEDFGLLAMVLLYLKHHHEHNHQYQALSHW